MKHIKLEIVSRKLDQTEKFLIKLLIKLTKIHFSNKLNLIYRMLEEEVNEEKI